MGLEVSGSPSPIGGANSEWAIPGALRDPLSGEIIYIVRHGSLAEDDALLAGGGAEWPMFNGLPFLRVRRDELRTEVVRAFRAWADGCDPHGCEIGKRLLLADRDDFAPGAPASTDEIITAEAAPSFRVSMATLGYGPVAHYFAHRAAVPTFLSGLSLLALAPPHAGGVLELCCGTGHFLRHLGGRRGPLAGSDVVFSKLWLAQTYLQPDIAYVCCDASAAPVPLPDAETPRTVFCHDALYFLPDKLHVLREMKRLAGPGGCVLAGHAHNSSADHGDVAGTPKTPAEYLALFEQAGMPAPDLYDDAELAESCLSHAKPQARSADELAGCEAIAAVWPGGRDYWDPALTLPAPGTPLSPNPLQVEENGTLRPDWPMPRFAEEYKTATYLTHRIAPDERPVLDAARREPLPFDPADAVQERLARRRVLLDVPEGW